MQTTPRHPMGPLTDQDVADDEVLPRGDTTLALRYLWTMLTGRRRVEARLMLPATADDVSHDLTDAINGLSTPELQELRFGLQVIDGVLKMVTPGITGLVVARETGETPQ